MICSSCGDIVNFKAQLRSLQILKESGEQLCGHCWQDYDNWQKSSETRLKVVCADLKERFNKVTTSNEA